MGASLSTSTRQQRRTDDDGRAAECKIIGAENKNVSDYVTRAEPECRAVGFTDPGDRAGYRDAIGSVFAEYGAALTPGGGITVLIVNSFYQ